MIEIRNLSKSFGEQVVLKDLNLSIGNETVGLLGANGSGKTTLIKSILGLLEFEGEILVNGKSLQDVDEEARAKIGYIPQYLPIWPDISVAEAMGFFGELRRASSDRQKGLLKEFGLEGHSAKKVGALSGGMRQKLSIAIALLSDPGVLLLDEPTANLDAWATREVLEIFQSWRGKRTVILSSHRLEEVQAISDRLVQVNGGRIQVPDLEEIRLGSQLRKLGKGAVCALS